MKKIVELEERWKIYRYRVAIFYLFIAILLVFLVFLGFFLKFQYDRHFAVSKIQTQVNVAPEPIVAPKPVADSVIIEEKIDNIERVNFVCRKVTADRLNVRQKPSFRSEAVGYYSRDSIFCTNGESVNGLLQTPNGWISAHEAYSHEVEVNMFADSGFRKFSPRIEEVRVLQDSPRELAQVNMPTQYGGNEVVASETRVLKEPAFQEPKTPASQSVNQPRTKPVLNITSEKMTKEREIELKKSDFRNTNKYETAIEIAEYYYNLKDYPNAIKWALNASSAESRGKLKTDSWIIYSKSLYASGNKEQAIEVLNRYISNTQSKDAIDVLNKMKNGII